MHFDRASILRSAHAVARHRLATTRSWRSYRQAFADALRREWRLAKEARAQAEFNAEAEIVLPTHVRDRCAALRLEASYEPLSFAGHDRHHALHREADAIADAARAAIALSKRGSVHVAH